MTLMMQKARTTDALRDHLRRFAESVQHWVNVAVMPQPALVPCRATATRHSDWTVINRDNAAEVLE